MVTCLQDRITLALINANVLTMDQAHSRAEAVAIAGGRIATVGSNAAVRRVASERTQVIDCRGLTLLPGINDAHCHLPGLARRLQDLDCRPDRIPSIIELQAAIRAWSAALPAERWVRGWGYDDLGLVERRHPNRSDLDAAAPDRPVWLEHRSGHAAVLNGRGLELAGVRRETHDPPGGVIERDPFTGEPTGVLYEMHGFLRQRLGGVRTSQEFEDGMRAVDSLFNSHGITSAQDAGADNGLDRWRMFSRLQASGVLSCRITMFAGIHRLGELSEAGLLFGSGNGYLRLGHAKIVLTLTPGALHPAPGELGEMIEDCHRRGFPVAVHCIEEEAIFAAAEALTTHRQPDLIDRIEHCAEGTPSVVEAVSRSGAMVVTQPGFLYHNGRSYRQNVDPSLLAHLYPAEALMEAGIPVAFGSDAPVIDPNPWPAIYSAVTRRTADGSSLSGGGVAARRIGVEDALRLYTLAGAAAEGTASFKGAIAPGRAADMVLVDQDPTAISVERLPKVQTMMTLIAGQTVWEKRTGAGFSTGPQG